MLILRYSNQFFLPLGEKGDVGDPGPQVSVYLSLPPITYICSL